MNLAYGHKIDIIADGNEIRITDIVDDHQPTFGGPDHFKDGIARFDGHGHNFKLQQVLLQRGQGP